ncbi:MAG: RNA methyltransferase, partial [Longimicrobiales bacterium]
RIAGIAHGTEPLIERISFHDSVWDAVSDASHVVGTTARRRTATYVWQHPREAAPALLRMPATAERPIAIVFGREDTGLRNEELDWCDRLLVVPTNPRHSSLNLAQAVLLIAYELWLAGAELGPLPRPKRKARPATPDDLRLLFDDVRATLDTIEFFKSRKEEAILRTFRAIVRRAAVDRREAKLLRAMAIEVRKYIARRLHNNDPSENNNRSGFTAEGASSESNNRSEPTAERAERAEDAEQRITD